MQLTSPSLEFNAYLLNKYNKPVPRYTSYPPATELSPAFDVLDFQAAIAVGNYRQTPLSLYCHIPFCRSACYFCGCNTIITQRQEIVEPYLAAIAQNIHQVADLVENRQVNQLHWGGGTPNYLSMFQVETLWATLERHFSFTPNAEISLEVNPSILTQEYLTFLRNLGFNRISFGIQDFNLQVQAAVNRIQPEAMLFQVMDWMRDAGFESVNVDLIYGLPYQSEATFRETLEKTLKLYPDRIAVFNFAYVPWLKPIQRRIPRSALPKAPEKLAILQMTIEVLTGRGYQFIGMDHFAKPDDELAIAQQRGELHRNFQGYTTQPESDLLGFGLTAISMLDRAYVQNHKRLRPYYQALEQGQLPLERGVNLSQDDIVRRSVIMELMCQFELSKRELEEKYHLRFDCDFDEYFSEERFALRCLEADGLVCLSPNHIEVTPVGRLLVRNIAAVFDPYLRQRQQTGFSQAV